MLIVSSFVDWKKNWNYRSRTESKRVHLLKCKPKYGNSYLNFESRCAENKDESPYAQLIKYLQTFICSGGTFVSSFNSLTTRTNHVEYQPKNMLKNIFFFPKIWWNIGEKSIHKMITFLKTKNENATEPIYPVIIVELYLKTDRN